MKPIKQYNLGGCRTGITNRSDLWSMPLGWPQMAWCTYQISWDWFGYSGDIKAVTLIIKQHNLGGCNGGITNGKDLWCILLKWTQMPWQIQTKFHDNCFRYPSNIKCIISTISNAVKLVLLMGGIDELCRWNGLRLHDTRLHTKFHDNQFKHLSHITIITRTIWESVMLVLLIEGIYEVCC
jgi:hypothetical protein